MRWVWSGEPADWAGQMTAIFTAASAIFTGAYVFLTFRLMRATSRMAEIAFLETRRDRIERLLPIRRTLDVLHEAVSAISISDRVTVHAARVAGVLLRTLYDLDAHADAALRVADELSKALAEAHAKAEHTYLIISETIAGSGTPQSQAAIAQSALKAVAAIDGAKGLLSRELERARGLMFQSSVG